MRDERGVEPEVNLEGVAHYRKIRLRSASGRRGVLGSWMVTVYIFMPYCAGKRFEEMGK